MNNLTSNQTFESECPPLKTSIVQVPRDDFYKTFVLVFVVINVLVALVAFVSNALLVYAIFKTPSLRIPSNILILGLAISDLGGSIISQPSYCALRLSELEKNVSMFCSVGKVYMSSVWCLGPITFFTLTAITTDRFLALHLHLRYKELVTSSRCLILLVCIWVFCTIVSMLRMLAVSHGIHILAVLILFISLMIDAFFLASISRVIWRHSVQIQAQQQSVQQSIDMPRYKKSVNTMYYVCGAFLLCYFPFLGVMVAQVIVKKLTEEMLLLYVITESLVMTNGLLNPIIYCWKKSDLRCAVVKTFLSIWTHKRDNDH